MRALLVNPWVYDFKAFDFWNKPVGLLMVATLLKKLGCAIDFIDCMDRQSVYYTTNTKTDLFGRGKYHSEIVAKPDIFRDIPRRYKRYGIPRDIFLQVIDSIEKPDIICVTSTMTYWYPGVFEAIKILKNKFPTVKIILGGIYATLCRWHAEKYSGAHILVHGPVEKSLSHLLRELGLEFHAPQEIINLVPDFSLYNNLPYGIILTSRGCPFNCTYCATHYLCPEFRTVPNTFVLQQLDYLVNKTTQIAFFDDALLYNKHFSELLKIIIQRTYALHFHTSNGLHCRYINEDIAGLMFKANFKTLYLSLETTNPTVQQQTGGKVLTEEFVHAVNILTHAGFPPDAIHTYILFGMPGQTPDEVFDSIDLCRSLGVHPHLCEFSPIPHTKEFEKTGFTERTDPLLHNNLFFTWYYPHSKPILYKKIKKMLTRADT
jgi:radical SAM superfamily enzyme YgiQ (UPF0313 family)